MGEHIALNPLGLAKQTGPLTVATPTVFAPYYSTSMASDPNLTADTPASGSKFKTFQTTQSVRKHGGTVTVMAEPNTAARWFDMLATKSSTTGAGPYTHTFGADANTDPNFYTMDLLVGSQVIRYFGVAASKLVIGWQGEKMQFQPTLSALGSFYGREIASVSTTTIVLKTDYDPNASLGLVVGDLVRVVKTDGSSKLDTTIASINADGVTVVLGASAAAFATGDMLVLRPQSVALSLITPFILPKTHYFFAADSTTALTNSATATNQTQLETGMTLEIMHDFTANDGEKRSGSFDPASLVRGRYGAALKTKQYLDATVGIKNWNAMNKQAFLMRSYAGSTNQYELRVGLNDIRIKSKLTPLTPGGIVFQEDDFIPNYDQNDAAGWSGLVTNNITSI